LVSWNRYEYIMDVGELKQDVREGRIDSDRLIEVIGVLLRKLEAAGRRIDALEEKLGKLTSKLDEPFSVAAEEKRQAARGKTPRKKNKPLRRGRVSTADKLAQAQRDEDVFPEGSDPVDCWFSHSRPVWRLEQGQAVLVAYHIYRGKKNRYGQIAGVIGRSEFGIEIVLAVAYPVYILGLSFDKACALLSFFSGLDLKKAQANALMNQLAREWEGEFETLCGLLAHSAVVYADETSWSINSVWAFLSDQARLLFFGVHKDAQTLKAILNRETFSGVLVSDDAAVYQNFTKAQKCWAHLLRKAIKLTLIAPLNASYREFADRLLAVYRQALKVKQDRRLSALGREGKVTELENELIDLCPDSNRWWDGSVLNEAEDSCRLLANELMRLLICHELFTFVLEADVEGTNNESERTLRDSAQARQTGRTNKTPRGARRQTIVRSVLESLRTQLSRYCLGTVVEEVQRWWQRGRSCFSKLAERYGIGPPETSVLNTVLPLPS
jgi:transposase